MRGSGLISKRYRITDNAGNSEALDFFGRQTQHRQSFARMFAEQRRRALNGTWCSGQPGRRRRLLHAGNRDKCLARHVVRMRGGIGHAQHGPDAIVGVIK